MAAATDGKATALDTHSVVLVQSCARGRMARRRAHTAQEEAQGDIENPPLEWEQVKPGQVLIERFAKDNGRDGEGRRLPKTVEELEFERQGGFSRVRQEEAIRFWTCVLWYGHALPEAVLLILIPILAVSPDKEGFRFYQTINFSWACSTFLGVFLTSQLSACYLRCIVVSARYLEPTGAAALRYDPQRHVPSAETMATAVEKATSASRLEIVLAALFFILELEISSAWLVGTLHGQALVGETFGIALWLQVILMGSFTMFIALVYPFIFRALRVGILRREKTRSIVYVYSRMYTVLPVVLLQCYIIMYFFLIITVEAPPVGLSMLYYSGANRGLICGSLDNANCTLTYDPADDGVNARFTAYRPDAVKCVGESGVAGYGSRYAACVAALVGDDIVFRAFCGTSASTTAVMTLISIELMHLIPIGVDQLLNPKHLFKRFAETGISRAVKLAILILYWELLCCLANLILFGWSGVGQTLYAYFDWFLLLFGTHKVLVASLVLTEFMRRRFTDTSSDLYTTQPDGQVVNIRVETSRLMHQLVTASQSLGGGDNRFACEARRLVTGKPRDAALGINFYMRVDKMRFAMPSYADGVTAIVREFEAHGTDSDRECLHYCLRARAGSSSKRFENGDRMRDCDAEGKLLSSRTDADGLGKTLLDFVNHPAAVTADLHAPHVLALRLYTTAAFRSLNNPLRETAAERRPHDLPITINFINQAISQLRAVEADLENATKSIDLWRGLKNIAPADDFMATGGTELAPMSTTTSLAVAVQYSLSPSSLILKLKTDSFMDRGADLGWISAFPDEAEVLFPPLTFLQPTGRSMSVEAHGFRFLIVEVAPKH